MLTFFCVKDRTAFSLSLGTTGEEAKDTVQYFSTFHFAFFFNHHRVFFICLNLVCVAYKLINVFFSGII